MALSKQLIAVSKVLAKVLRHEPELIGIKLDAQGYVEVNKLVEMLNAAARRPGAVKRIKELPHMTLGMLQEVVENNDKRRYSFSQDGRRLRAAQGHSVDVGLGYEALEPPSVLFHGTAVCSLGRIWREGLKPRSRLSVHLTACAETAMQTGRRHGKPVVLKVDARQMYAGGFRFSCSDNDVWLVSEVPAEFITLHEGRP